MEKNLVKIYEGPVPKANSKILIQEILEENNIPYQGKVEEYWTGIKNPKYNVKFVIYVEDKFKLQAEKYIEENYNKDNKLVNDIEELQTDEDMEYEVKKYNKKQKLMQRILIGIVVAIMVLAIIIGIFA